MARVTKPLSLVLLIVLTLLSAPLAAQEPDAEESGITPGTLAEELYTALIQPGRISTQKYVDNLSMDFASWRIGGSLNLPVVAAATALIEATKGNPAAPPLPQMVDWWTKFLTCQNTPGACTVSSPGRLVYFKGSEVFSYTYQWSVDVSVVVVNWWAARNGNPTLQNAARSYLRKTWSLYGLAAGSGSADTYLDNTDSFGNVIDNTTFVHRCHRSQGGQLNYNGPFLALAATRSGPSFFCADNKMVLFSRAIEWPALIAVWEAQTPQKNLRTYLESTWPGNAYGESVYALNTGERQLLLDQINFANQVTVLLGVINGGGTRFQAPIHFLAWPGVRMSLIETTPGPVGNPGKTAFAVKYEAGLRRAHFLYPWLTGSSAPKAPYRHGYGALLPTVASPTYAEGSSKAADETVGPHGFHVVSFPVPAAKPIYHVVVGPGGDGYLVP